MTIYNIINTNNTQQATAISVIYLFFFLLQATAQTGFGTWLTPHMFVTERGIADAVRIAGVSGSSEE